MFDNVLNPLDWMIVHKSVLSRAMNEPREGVSTVNFNLANEELKFSARISQCFYYGYARHTILGGVGVGGSTFG